MKTTILLFFLYPILVVAQDSLYTLKPIEIIGLRSGISNFKSFEIIQKDDIQKGEAGLSLEESLESVPGLIVSDRNNPSLGDKLSIRGIGSRASFGIRGIKILVDNVPLTLPDGQSQTNNIDLYSAGSISILKGPSSFLYGNASGGVINIFSEIPEEKFSAVSQAIFGTNNLQKYSLKLSGKFVDYSYLVSFNKLQNNGYREHSAENYYLINSVFKRYFSENLSLSLVINYFNSPYLLNPSSLSKESALADPRSSREFVKLQGAGEMANQIQSGVTLSYTQNDLSIETTFYLLGRNLLNPIPGRIVDLTRTSSGIRSTAEKLFNLSDFKLKVSGGIDFEFQNDRRKEFENNGLSSSNLKPDEIFENLNFGSMLIDQDEEVIGLGPFISTELSNHKIGFLAGLRYDHYSFRVDDKNTNNSSRIIMEQLSPAAGIFFKPNNSAKMFLNFSTSFQTPTTSELSNRPEGEGGFNPDLAPERINSYEIGINYSLPFTTNISAAAFILSFNRLLIPYQIQNSEEIFYRNAGQAENKGIEVLLNYSPFKNLKFLFSYTYMSFTFKDYRAEYQQTEYQLSGNNVPGIPGNNLAFKISYFGKTGLFGELSAKWNDKYFTNDFNGPPPNSSEVRNNFINDSFFKTDIKLGYNHQLELLDIEGFIGINNILNKRYNASIIPNAAGNRFFEPASGRNFYGGIKLIF